MFKREVLFTPKTCKNCMLKRGCYCDGFTPARFLLDTVLNRDTYSNGSGAAHCEVMSRHRCVSLTLIIPEDKSTDKSTPSA